MRMDGEGAPGLERERDVRSHFIPLSTHVLHPRSRVATASSSSHGRAAGGERGRGARAGGRERRAAGRAGDAGEGLTEKEGRASVG